MNIYTVSFVNVGGSPLHVVAQNANEALELAVTTLKASRNPYLQNPEVESLTLVGEATLPVITLSLRDLFGVKEPK